MAGNGDSSLRSQLSISRDGGSRLRSELALLDVPPGRRKSGHSMAASSIQSDEKRCGSAYQNNHFQSRVSVETNGDFGVRVSNPARAPVRTIPVWVQNRLQVNATGAFSPSMPTLPNGVRVAEHHFAPREKQSYQGYGPRDQFQRESRWKSFMQSTMYTQATSLEEKKVDADWLDAHFGDYSEPWQGGTDEADLESGFGSLSFNQRRKKFTKRLQRTILQSPMIPLIIRLTVFVYSVVALALGGSIRHFATKYNHPQGPSAEMAIVVDAVALVYLVYITWDEYTGKPLGLRPPKAKMRLLFLDLIFIVFASANLSLAFESLSDVTSSCTSGRVNDEFDPRNDIICDRQKALASVLLVALLAWLMTFAISVLRVVERVSAK
ncbi:hypothetical protein CIHG_08734 [Coccidioides immitis H538.4]|uniref:Regulator of phospholipase D SRF1 n=1 Tax=Coccidioides immitis H538.4 TaxID=396776 RepID=A0A0J8S362_COCIT|nr:hypothetical protein CIHG_08734 [Coccidioides immitis H538.4]